MQGDPNPDLYRRYFQRDPDNVPMQVALANALLRLKEPRAAIEIPVRALRLDPLDTNALDYLAVAEAAQGNHRRALEILKRAVAKNPDHALCWINLGITHKSLGDFDAALADYDEALRYALIARPTASQDFAKGDATAIGRTPAKRGHFK